MCLNYSILYAWMLFSLGVRFSQGGIQAKGIAQEAKQLRAGVEIDARGMGQMWLPNLKEHDQFLRQIRAPSGGRGSADGTIQHIGPSGSRAISFFYRTVGKLAGRGQELDATLRSIQIFKQEYETATTIEGQWEAFNNAVAYLLGQPNLSLKEKKAWIKPLKEITKEFRKSRFIEPKTETLMGFQNLYLKYSKNKCLSSPIKDFLEKRTKVLRKIGAYRTYGDIALWVKEILKPESGLDENMKTWSKFNKLILDERQLNALRIGISQNHEARKILKYLPNLKQIFQNPTEFTVQTRLAGITMMHHLIENDSMRSATLETIKDILIGKDFLFYHEIKIMWNIIKPWLLK